MKLRLKPTSSTPCFMSNSGLLVGLRRSFAGKMPVFIVTHGRAWDPGVRTKAGRPAWSLAELLNARQRDTTEPEGDGWEG